jgi:hypothetical protein
MPPIARHAFAAIVLAAAAGSAAEAQQAQHLECAGPFARDATAGTLVSVFGAANVVNGTIDGPEGSTLDATLVFPEDPARRLALLWQDEVSRARPAAILIQVEAANGAPFNILGFGWDYGGSAGFEEGTLADLPGGCVLSLTFQIDESVEGPEFDAIMGDKQFRSDNPLIRKAAPTVSQIAVGYPME